MTMNFRTIKSSLITILGNAEAGRYRTIGYQRQGQSADENLNNERSVQVFYNQGEFPRSAGSMSGEVMHGLTFAVQMTVATPAKGDLSVIDNDSATQVDVANAIDAIQDSQQLADDSMDEFIDILYQVLMDAENVDVGLDIGDVSNRWVDNVQKDQPIKSGQYVVLTGSMQFTCSCDEEVTGDSGTAGNAIDTEIICEDTEGNADIGKAGVLNGGP
jgi:hypothetical protein